MLSTLEKVSMFVAAGEFIVGLLGNGFIGLTKCTAGIRKQKLYLVDIILTSLAWARFIQLWQVILSLSLVVTCKEIQITSKRTEIFSNTWILNNHLCTWFATCLAVFYFLKIANFSHPLFLWLKWRINKVIFMLLVVSVPFLIISFPMPPSFGVFEYQTCPKCEINMTELFHVSKANLNYMFILTIAGLPPFCLSLISFFLLLFSLWRHKKHIKLNIMNSRDPSLEAHFRAMKSVFFFLVLFLLNHFALFITAGAYYILHNKQAMTFGYVLGLLYPSAHSYVVIFGNSQMKKAFLGVFWYLKHYLKRKVSLATYVDSQDKSTTNLCRILWLSWLHWMLPFVHALSGLHLNSPRPGENSHLVTRKQLEIVPVSHIGSITE